MNLIWFLSKTFSRIATKCSVTKMCAFVCEKRLRKGYTNICHSVPLNIYHTIKNKWVIIRLKPVAIYSVSVGSQQYVAFPLGSPLRKILL